MNFLGGLILLVLVTRALSFDFDNYKITWDLPPIPTSTSVPSTSVTVTPALVTLTTVTSASVTSDTVISDTVTAPDVLPDPEPQSPALSYDLLDVVTLPTIAVTPASVTFIAESSVLPTSVPSSSAQVSPLLSALAAKISDDFFDGDLDLAYDLENQLPSVPPLDLNTSVVNVTFDDLESSAISLVDKDNNNGTFPDNYPDNSTVTFPDTIWDKCRDFLSTSEGRTFFLLIVLLG